MISGTRALSWAVGTLEIISDAQGAAYGIFEIIDHVSILVILCQFVGHFHNVDSISIHAEN